MRTEYRSLYAIDAHIKAYWQDIHGVEKSINDNPKNQFLNRLNGQIVAIIQAVDSVTKQGLSLDKYDVDDESENSIAQIHQGIFESLRTIKSELHTAKTQYSMDEKFQALITLLEQDVEGAEQHLDEVITETGNLTINASSRQCVMAYAKFLGGTVIDAIPQKLFPFLGSEADKNNPEKISENMGLCYGLVNSWGNERPMDTEKSFLTQEEQLKKFIHTKRSSPIYKVREMLSRHGNFEKHFFYNALILDSSTRGSAHIIGIRECNGINEFEVCDPNYGIFRFPNRERAIDFLEYLACTYSVMVDYTDARIGMIPIDNPKLFVKRDEPKCKPASYQYSINDIAYFFIILKDIIISKSNEEKRDENIKIILNILVKINPNKFNHVEKFINKLNKDGGKHISKEITSIFCLLSNLLAVERVDKNVCIKWINEINSFDFNQGNKISLKSFYSSIIEKIFPGISSDEFFKLNENNQSILIENILLYEIGGWSNKYDFNKLVDVFKKYEKNPEVLRGLSSYTYYMKSVDTLINYDPDLLNYISEMLYGKRDLSKQNMQLIKSIADVFYGIHNESIVLQNKDIYNKEFLMTMEEVVKILKTEKRPHIIFKETNLALEYKKALKSVNELFSKKNSFDHSKLNEFLNNYNALVGGSLCNDKSKKEWEFLKELATLIKDNKSNEEIADFIVKNCGSCVSSLAKCKIILHSDNRLSNIFESVIKNIIKDLNNENNLKLISMIYKDDDIKLSLTDISPEILYNNLTDKNIKYLLPILFDKKMIEKMSHDQFKEMLEKIVSLDPNYKRLLDIHFHESQNVFLVIVNDTLFSNQFIKTLSDDKIMVLFNFLMADKGNGHSIAECFQYPERASRLQQKIGQSSQFVGKISPPETRWSQVISNLREQFKNSRTASTEAEDVDTLFNDKYKQDCVIVIKNSLPLISQKK